MKKQILILFYVLFCMNISAQTFADSDIEELYTKGDYKMLTERYGSKDQGYSANSLFYIGSAYSLLEDDDNCIKFTNLSIAKDSLNPGAYYIKGVSLIYKNHLKESIPLFQKNIILESDSSRIARSYRQIGYAYYNLEENNKALENYKESIKYEKKVSIPYIMIAQTYAKMKQEDNALKAYYWGKENALKEGDYTTILYNIGLMEKEKGNYNQVESAYKELIQIDPNDYHAYAKLIQVHYYNREYEKAKPLKAVLYQAHKDSLLEDNLSDMFCIDQFIYKNRKIQVHERYEEGDQDYIYNKILFYVFDQKGEIEYRIQTEYSPAAVANKEAKYILCANRNGAHLNYGIGFTDESTYDQIKATVMKVIDNPDKEARAITIFNK